MTIVQHAVAPNLTDLIGERFTIDDLFALLGPAGTGFAEERPASAGRPAG